MAKSFDSRIIANRMLKIAEKKNIPLSMMQLVKLVYLAHGWWLTFSGGQPLTSDKPEVWRFGPVHPVLFRTFEKNGTHPIRNKAKEAETGFEFNADLPEDMEGILEQVVESYGRKPAFQLSNMTHKPGTPWYVAREKRDYYTEITDAEIKEHFDELGTGKS